MIAKIKEGLENDSQAWQIVLQVRAGRTRQFTMQGGVLYYATNPVYLPKWADVCRHVLRECHDSVWAGHPGQKQTMVLLERGFYWPSMRDDVERYVRTCLPCQQDKAVKMQPAGLFQPLPVPVRPWASVSMDFITQLPNDGFASIMVVVDQFSKLLDAAQFSYNLQKSESSKYSPFDLATGQQPLTPHTMLTGYRGADVSATELLKTWNERVDLARYHLTQASDRMKKFVDRHRRKLEFNVGDKVLVRMDQNRFKMPKGLSASLVRRFDGPFEVTQKISPVAYKLCLPLHSGTQPVFHVSQLRPHHLDEEDLVRNIPHRGPTNILDNPEKRVTQVLATRILGGRKRNIREFLVVFEGQEPETATWERGETLWRDEIIMQFLEQRNPSKPK
ncbi:uncharacterized protein LOC131857796 [Cryptomeria japonica]|uniref:uncharacterized protein LOC131857796 n=1 Tax=Cryptomeria japonica TaxID=3369 RepID=UPI0027D9DFB8|nr:uncharacterized protein LOC131857796 [Cryptomeria japonica]